MLNGKKLMVLGAGIFQLPAIEKAKELGIKVIVCSNNSNDPGMKKADKAYNISTLHKEKILNISQKEKIDGIMTIASEIASPTVAYVANSLNLKGYEYKTTKIILNKYQQRDFLKKSNINTPKYGKAKNLKEAINLFERINSPAIMKPLESSGSKGVFLIRNKNSIRKYFTKSKKFSCSEKGVIIEEFINGIEVGGEALIWKKELIFFQITNKYKNQHFVPVGHSLPSVLPSHLQEKIRNLIKKAIKKFKLEEGALNFDVFIDQKNDDPIIIELGCRLGGNCLPIIMHLQTDVDTIKETIKIALGIKPEINIQYSEKSYCVKIIGAERSGRIINLNDKKIILSRYKNINEISYDYKVGDFVREFKQGNYRLGHIIFSTKNIEKTLLFFHQLRNIIDLRIS